MDFFSIAGLTIVTAVLALVLRHHKPEYGMLVAIAGGILILFIVINQVGQIFTYAEKTLNEFKIPSNSIKVLIKALGIAYVAQLSSDACKDSGELALASKIELAGKISIVIVALPLLDTFIKVIQKILG